MALRLFTSAFVPGGTMPTNFTGEGKNESPLLRWEGAPASTQSYALLMEDPDAPGETFCHWLLYDIPTSVVQLDPAMPQEEEFPSGMKQGINDAGEVGYYGPLPPPGKKHQYVFRLFALAKPPGLRPRLSKKEFADQIRQQQILDQTEITVFYKRFSKLKKAV